MSEDPSLVRKPWFGIGHLNAPDVGIRVAGHAALCFIGVKRVLRKRVRGTAGTRTCELTDVVNFTAVGVGSGSSPAMEVAYGERSLKCVVDLECSFSVS